MYLGYNRFSHNVTPLKGGIRSRLPLSATRLSLSSPAGVGPAEAVCRRLVMSRRRSCHRRRSFRFLNGLPQRDAHQARQSSRQCRGLKGRLSTSCFGLLPLAPRKRRRTSWPYQSTPAALPLQSYSRHTP